MFFGKTALRAEFFFAFILVKTSREAAGVFFFAFILVKMARSADFVFRNGREAAIFF